MFGLSHLRTQLTLRYFASQGMLVLYSISGYLSSARIFCLCLHRVCRFGGLRCTTGVYPPSQLHRAHT
jgi:hypothetical protein